MKDILKHSYLFSNQSYTKIEEAVTKLSKQKDSEISNKNISQKGIGQKNWI